MSRLACVVLASTLLVACGDDSPVGPSATAASIAVSVSSPLRMGQTSQASGTASRTNGQSQALTAGWLSDAPGVATTTDAGLVTGVANGRATIYVISGGQQGQQVIRVVPDYQGRWTGGLRVTACTQTGIFATVNLCDSFPAGFTSGYSLALSQAGELMTATADYGSDAVFPAVAAPIQADGGSTFAPMLSITEPGITVTIEAAFAINSTRVGAVNGTVTEVWRVPNVAGEARLTQELVSTTRSSTTALVSGSRGPSEKFRSLARLATAAR